MMINARRNLNRREKIAILGFGVEGQSTLRFLQKSPQYKNAEIWILDRNTKLQKPTRDIRLQLGASYLTNLNQFDIIFRSPGIPYLTKEIQKAKQNGTKISSATKLFFSALYEKRTNKKPLVIGVTGSKGKGTTCTLLQRIFEQANKKTMLLGNIGKPMLDSFKQALTSDIVILELSSFQLQDIEQSPDISVIVDVFPEHLDHHKTIREYVDAKANIARHQTSHDTVFYFKNNALSRRIAQKSKGKKIGVMPKEKGVLKNFDIARAVAHDIGIKKSIVESAIKNFKGLEHRLELVRTIRVKQHTHKLKFISVSFYNDTTATNPHATKAAIESFRNPIILIAGGRDKGLDYSPLIHAVKRAKNLKTIVLYGENKLKLARALKRTKKEIVISKNNLQSTIDIAYKNAQQSAIRNQKSTIVLFSPGATSFDMFKNMYDRGEQFKKIVKAL